MRRALAAALLLPAAAARASSPIPPELEALAARAPLGGPVVGWCRAELGPAAPGSYAVAAGTARKLDASVRESGLHGRIAPRGETGVICGFVEDTKARCWQYSAKERRLVEIGGWIT